MKMTSDVVVHNSHPLDRTSLRDLQVCSKCLGLGTIILMHRPLSTDFHDLCPTCNGLGMIRKPNSYSDPLPATLSV